MFAWGGHEIMTDVFISYSKDDRAIAETLALQLEAKGLKVWWDTNLVGGETFRDAIQEQLEVATVVTVLWSPSSIKSRYVIDEADVAAASGKLVSILVGGLSAEKMPMGFRTSQSVRIGDETGIDRALQRRGLQLAAALSYVEILDQESKEEEAWQFIKSQGFDYHMCEAFKKTFPNSKHAKQVSVNQYVSVAYLSVIWLFAIATTTILFFHFFSGKTVSYSELLMMAVMAFAVITIPIALFKKRPDYNAFVKFLSRK
jgi:hypothetical protein